VFPCLISAAVPSSWPSTRPIGAPYGGDQLALYNELMPEFRRFNAALIGISVDGVWCHLAYARDRKLRFPLLADFEPKGAVARMYGAYRHSDGVCERALFVLDAEETMHWSYVSPIGINAGADGILAALEELSKQEAPR
jgi:peroxiredoxin